MGILICDLERSRFNLALVSLAAQLLSRSKVVHYDGPQSVKGAFTRDEFRRLSEYSMGVHVDVHNAFPCRFIAHYVP
jgi:hypothetical protein